MNEPTVILALGHNFPTYAGTPGVARVAEGRGDYVHELHIQALAERVIIAREALKQGRTGKAREILDEAWLYLSSKTHTR